MIRKLEELTKKDLDNRDVHPIGEPIIIEFDYNIDKYDHIISHAPENANAFILGELIIYDVFHFFPIQYYRIC